MLALLFQLQTAALRPVADTATYATPALERLVADASARNQRVPPSLGGYRASVESEISLGFLDALAGREKTTSVEQVASSLAWERTGEFEQHVTGYRSQTLGPQFATLGFFRSAWAVPSLYGNRLALLFGREYSRESAGRGAPRADSATMWAVHPLSDDRETVYRYTGGDTVEALHAGARTVRIVKIEVTPRASLPQGTVVFTGEVDLDAERRQVVRMRGSFARVERPVTGLAGMLRGPLRLEAVAYVELVNGEFEGAFWLPQYQRFEGQAGAPLLGDDKAIFRIVSTFRQYDIRTRAAVAVDTLRVVPHVLSFASRDSLSSYRSWRAEIGDATSQVRAVDFDDVAPPRARATGEAIVDWRPESATDAVHINRIEGPFTGVSARLRLRDALPGAVVRATAGYAWSERTVRGRLSAELTRGVWRYAVRGGRALDPTNDFTGSVDSIGVFSALFGQDDFDYVDRRYATALATRLFTGIDALARVEAGWAQDRQATMHLARSPLGGDPFLPDRGVDAGDYLRSGLTFEWHPDADAEFLQTGTGAALRYVRGDGQLRFQRIEGRFTTRRNYGQWTVAMHLAGGVVSGATPPQELFEVGRELGLPGYGYKQFAGEQAAVARGSALYRLGVLGAPVHLYRRYWLPALDPALVLSLQSAWTGVTSEAARSAMLRLAPGAATTGDARSSVAAGLRFFGGTVGFDVARPLDHVAPWSVRLAIGRAL